MEINFKQFLAMLRFLWVHGPPRLKFVLLPLALVAGFSRDYVMIVVNKAAAAPLDVVLSFWLPMFAVAFVVVIGSYYFYQVTTVVVTTYVTNNVRVKMINGLMKVQPSFLDRQQHGGIYHILTTDVSAVANFTSKVLGLLPSIVFLCVAVPQLFYYSFFAGFFSVLVMVGGILSYYLQQKAMASLNADARAMDVAYFERVSEMLRGFRELRLHLPRRRAFLNDIADVLARLRQMLIKVNRIYEGGEAAVHALKFMLLAGIVFIVPAVAATESTITFQVLTLVLFSLTPFEQIVSSYPSVIGTLVSFVRIADLDNQLAPHVSIPEMSPDRPPGFAKIEMKSGVAVHNSREQSGFVLGPINFEIKRGEIVFLIGSNGSGKTTFMNAISGLIDLEEGVIEVDGRALVSSDMAQYRARISAIFPQYHVFRQLYGIENVEPAIASAALEKVGLNGLTEVSDGAFTRIDLSAGQKRRLAMAIALLEDRDFLVLDEFVADQDPEQREYFFTKLLPELKAKGKSLLVSTHDMHWVQHCDRIYKFDGGKMEEVTHLHRPQGRAA